MTVSRTRRTLLTVIVPVWHGETTMARSLDGLLHQRFTKPTTVQEISVIVAVNDGRIETLNTAQRYTDEFAQIGYDYQVLQTAPGRFAAFNKAEQCANSGGRLYLDQDAALSPYALQRLLTFMSQQSCAAFIAFELTFSESESAYVRSFLRGWGATDYVQKSPVTAGAYAVSEAGRARWGRFLSTRLSINLIGQRRCVRAITYP